MQRTALRAASERGRSPSYKLMRFRNLALIPILGLVFICACEHRKEITLSSGKKVQVTPILHIDFPDGPGMALKYYSPTAAVQNAALKSEVSEVWEQYFKAEVDRGHVTNAMIIAMDVPKKVLSQTITGYDYEFKKSADGSWSMTK